MEYLEENKIITISLGNKVKEKIKNKFNRDIEEFIEKELINTIIYKNNQIENHLSILRNLLRIN